MIISKVTGIKRLYYATKYSLQGLRLAFCSEPAIRQELFASVILVPMTFFLDVTLTQQLLLIGSLFIVLITELLNSAIEAVVDRISSDFHELSGKAKDIGSAAVFVALVFAITCWVTILWAH